MNLQQRKLSLQGIIALVMVFLACVLFGPRDWFKKEPVEKAEVEAPCTPVDPEVINGAGEYGSLYLYRQRI
tara:strand:- start:2114 stop:2326 length:213 start_codon:yes stop_codon:yes gene_type:complete